MKRSNLLIILLCCAFGVMAQQPLSLTNAITKALENNYGVVVAQSNQEIAELRNNWGTAGRYPYVNLTLGDNNSFAVNEENNLTNVRLTAGASVNWTLFDGFAVKISKNRLEELESLSANNTANLIESTVQSVILAYYDVLLQREKLVTFEEVMKLSSDRYERAKESKNYGTAVTFDVLQAQNAYLSDRSTFLLQQVSYKNALRNLKFLMADKSESDYELSDKFEALPKEYLLADLQTQLTANNKSLRSQFINQRLLDNALASAKSQFMPSLNFVGGATQTRNGNQPEGGDMSWANSANFYGNFTLSWNLFSGGSRKRAVQIANIDKEIGAIELSEMQHDLSNKLANLFEFYQVRKELLNVARENMEAAKLNLQISQDKFNAGAINSFNFRDVQLIYLRAAQGELEAVYNFIDAHTSLLRMTGVILQEYE